jgi:hypothetical protein
MSDDKKSKAKAKAPAKDPVVYVLYRGEAEIVGVCTSAERAMSEIASDRDVQFARISIERAKRNRA